jgi:AcrR family transcriptional regulator
MSAFGIPQDEIAKVLGIAKTTLHTHYRDELDTAETRMLTAVAQSLYKQALGERDASGKVILAPSVAACCFILKTRGGWRETNNLNHVSEDGTMSPNRELSDEELDRELIQRGLPTKIYKE